MSAARTEPASPRRLTQALAAGVRPISRDALTFASLVAAWLVLAQHLPSFWSQWRSLLTQALHAAATPSIRHDTLFAAARACFETLIPIGLAILAATLIASAAQGMVSLRSRRHTSLVVTRAAWLGWIWLAVKGCVIALGFASVVHLSLRAILATSTADLGYAQRVMTAMAGLITSRVGTVLALLVIADLVVARVMWRNSLRMTRDESRRELQDTEADPMLKAEQRTRRNDARSEA